MQDGIQLALVNMELFQVADAVSSVSREYNLVYLVGHQGWIAERAAYLSTKENRATVRKQTILHAFVLPMENMSREHQQRPRVSVSLLGPTMPTFWA